MTILSAGDKPMIKRERARVRGLALPAHLRDDNSLSVSSLANLAKSDPDAFVHRVRRWTDASAAIAHGLEPSSEQLEGISLREAEAFSLSGMRPEKFQALRQALDGVNVEARVHEEGGTRAVTAGAFPLLTSALVVIGVNEAYESISDPTPELVTDVDDMKRESSFIGVLSADKSDITRKTELDTYTEFGASEESFHVGHLDQGFQIVLSQSLIDEADLPNIVARLTAVGELAKTYQVEQVLRRITDHDGSASSGAEPYVLHGPTSSAGRALYVTSNAAPLDRLPTSGNRITSNPLADIANLEAARARLSSMKDSRGKRIHIPLERRKLLIPDALMLKAWTLTNSVGVPGSFNEVNMFGPNGPARPRAIISDARMDDLSTSAWYYGDFQRQFFRKWKVRPEVVTYGGASTLPYTTRREALRVRIGWDMEVGARDFVYVVQCLSGTTAPKDES